MTGQTHFHSSSWIIMIVLFIAVLILHKQGKEKAEKNTLMALRLFYLITIGTGLLLGITAFSINPFLYSLKFLFGIIVIGVMEMMIARLKKDTIAPFFWALFIVFVFATLYMGYKLPLGVNFFS